MRVAYNIEFLFFFTSSISMVVDSLLITKYNKKLVTCTKEYMLVTSLPKVTAFHVHSFRRLILLNISLCDIKRISGVYQISNYNALICFAGIQNFILLSYFIRSIRFFNNNIVIYKLVLHCTIKNNKLYPLIINLLIYIFLSKNTSIISTNISVSVANILTWNNAKYW